MVHLFTSCIFLTLLFLLLSFPAPSMMYSWQSHLWSPSQGFSGSSRAVICPVSRWISKNMTIPPSFLEWWSYPSPWVLLLGCQFCFQGLSASSFYWLWSLFAAAAPQRSLDDKAHSSTGICAYIWNSQEEESSDRAWRNCSRTSRLCWVWDTVWEGGSWRRMLLLSPEHFSMWQNLEAVFCLPV